MKGRSGSMVRAMVGVGTLCGAVIVTVVEVTRPRIAHNQAVALEQAIARVLPEVRSSVETELDGQSFYIGRDEAGHLVGLAIPTSGTGYQDRIRVLYGYDPMAQEIIGLEVLQSRETPGLGDRIETDPAFGENFRHLDVALDGPGGALVHPIELVAAGTKTEAWQIDGISGATISCRAIAAMLRESTAALLPSIQRDLEQMRESVESAAEGPS